MTVLVKRIQSPEAKRHKVEYDTKYESSPKRVEYREELNQERRKRGMYGDRSHRDISHTQNDKLTVEDEHANRARHFKDKGTLRPVQKSSKGYPKCRPSVKVSGKPTIVKQEYPLASMAEDERKLPIPLHTNRPISTHPGFSPADIFEVPTGVGIPTPEAAPRAVPVVDAQYKRYPIADNAHYKRALRAPDEETRRAALNEVPQVMTQAVASGRNVFRMPTFYGMPFNEETYFTTGEPMDLAMDALLKASMYFGAGENADPKGVRQASLEGHQFASQPAMQQAAQASDARIRDLTGGSQELGTMLSTNQWNPESAWGGQSEETPFRGINLSEYGRRLGLGQFGDNEETQERKLIDHMGQTATHEAMHEAQRLPLNEAFSESIYAGNNPPPQQYTNWDEYGAIAGQVGPTPSPNFYPGLTGQQATQALADMHPAIVQTGEPMDLAFRLLKTEGLLSTSVLVR